MPRVRKKTVYDFRPMTLRQAPLYIAMCTGRMPKPSVVRNWATDGLLGVRLGVTFGGGSPYTSISAIDEFLAAVTKAARRQTRKPRPKSIGQVKGGGR